MPVLAAVSSGVGERQGGVKSIETMMVARFGMVGLAGKRAREQQRLGRDVERVDTQVGIMYTRGHRVNSALRPT